MPRLDAGSRNAVDHSVQHDQRQDPLAVQAPWSAERSAPHRQPDEDGSVDARWSSSAQASGHGCSHSGSRSTGRNRVRRSGSTGPGREAPAPGRPTSGRPDPVRESTARARHRPRPRSGGQRQAATTVDIWPVDQGQASAAWSVIVVPASGFAHRAAAASAASAAIGSPPRQGLSTSPSTVSTMPVIAKPPLGLVRASPRPTDVETRAGVPPAWATSTGERHRVTRRVGRPISSSGLVRAWGLVGGRRLGKLTS